MNTTSPEGAAALPLLPYALRVADILVPPLSPVDPVAHLDLTPKQVSYPLYRVERDSLWPVLSDKYLSLVAPIVVYWVYSLVYEVIDRMEWPLFERYRIHEPEEITARNKVSKTQVIKMVALQQVIQTVLGIVVLESEEVMYAQVHMDHQSAIGLVGNYLGRIVSRLAGSDRAIVLLERYGIQLAEWAYWWLIPVAQYWWSFFVMDAWQYFWHRAAHESRFLYRHFHSHHHRLYVPYAFGALYNHPLEGLVLDSLGAAVSYTLSLMTVRQGILLFFFSTLKTVDDHGGYAFPWWIDPLHLLFPNTAEYHDIHHQMQGLRYNYSQPFFIHFDVLLGTRMGPKKLAKLREYAAKKTWKQEGKGTAPVSVEKETQHEVLGTTSALEVEFRKTGTIQRIRDTPLSQHAPSASATPTGSAAAQPRTLLATSSSVTAAV